MPLSLGPLFVIGRWYGGGYSCRISGELRQNETLRSSRISLIRCQNGSSGFSMPASRRCGGQPVAGVSLHNGIVSCRRSEASHWRSCNRGRGRFWSSSNRIVLSGTLRRGPFSSGVRASPFLGLRVSLPTENRRNVCMAKHKAPRRVLTRLLEGRQY
ncbi:hypothetical protein ACLOJK_014639 [Asimina triloba]